MPSGLTKLLSLLISFCLILEQSVFAQSLDLSAHFANFGRPIAQTDKFRPLHLRSISYDLQDNDFKLLLDKGDTKFESLGNGRDRSLQLNNAVEELLKYFFIGLTLPNEKFWVNLRPDSPDNILDPDLEKTDIGRIFLEADLQLKKDTAQWTSPQTKEGKAYWDKLYQKAGELFGTENITIPTLTRPWIVPNEIIIRESTNDGSTSFDYAQDKSLTTSAYIYKATLKVMLEEDYLGSQVTGHRSQVNLQEYSFKDSRMKELNEYSTQLIRENIIPKLTYEVNTSKRYAPLRQVYYSLILAQWFKARHKGLSPQGTVPFLKLIDSGDLTNLTSQEPYDKQTYFKQYQKSFKDGEYNLSEPVYTPYGQSIRRYMSGGMALNASSVIVTVPANSKEIAKIPRYLQRAEIDTRAVSASPVLSLNQPGLNTPLQQLAQDQDRYLRLIKNYEHVIQRVEKEIGKAYTEKDSTYEEAFSIGARAAIKLKVFELLIEGKAEEDIINAVVYNFLPTLQEYIYGAFLPIGTEIEIWRGFPYTKIGNPNYYNIDLAEAIWQGVLGLPVGNDGLIEFALPPSRSGLTQVAMIDSMIKIGLIPKGWFSLHISVGMPPYTHITDKMASYLELIKVLLYTSDKRIDYFASKNLFPLKIRDFKISKVAGKLPPFAIYNSDTEGSRFEYRSGDVVVPAGFAGDTFSNYGQAITFTQVFHSLAYLTLTAPIGPRKIENKFSQELLKIFAEFIRQIDNWRQKIPEKDKEIGDLFEELIVLNSYKMKGIIRFRKEEQDLLKNLEDIVNNLRKRTVDLLAEAEITSKQPRVPEDIAGNSPLGGIDFTHLPVVTQAITNLGLSPLKPSSYSSLRRLNLSEEYQAIERLASSGITPSPERLKSFIQASCLQDEIGEEKDKTLGLLAEVLRDEESNLRPTAAGLMDILVALESITSSQQLKEIFLGKGI